MFLLFNCQNDVHYYTAGHNINTLFTWFMYLKFISHDGEDLENMPHRGSEHFK